MLGPLLKVMGLVRIAVGLFHGLYGVSGDWLLGIAVPSPVDPSLDSQNRFYGVTFGLFGVLLWMGGADLRRFAPVLRAMFAVMFLAGCARGLAVIAHGWPTLPVIALWASELILPPVFWFWLGREIERVGRLV